MPYAKILVPVDGSVHSRLAVKHALDLADRKTARVIVLNCRRPLPSSIGEPNASSILERQIRNAEEVFEILRPLWKEMDVSVEEKVVGGRTADVIAEVAETEKVDLIVMGSKGKSDLEGLFLGSVTHKVLNLAPCPVLVIKA